MSIATRQTLRSFAIGFALGAVAIAMTVGHDRMPNLSDQVVPAAVAAPAQQDAAPAQQDTAPAQ